MFLSAAGMLTGGCVWLLKVALIWANGGTDTTGGIIGILFLSGFFLLGLAAGIQAWYLSAAWKTWGRVLAVLVSAVLVVAMVDLPILLGRQIFGPGWQAEETGVVLTALVALGVGVRWLRAGHQRRAPARPQG